MSTQDKKETMLNELALFAGAGGGILAGQSLGWRCVCAVEHDAYAAGVLVARQNDGCLEAFPVWDDVRTFDGRAWRGVVDVVSGGFPCTDISCAGKGAGIEGEESGLWREMARIIGEVRPRFAFVENSPMLVQRGLGLVLSDLAAMGYDARWGIVGADDAGAPHRRKRIWILAYSKMCGFIGQPFGEGGNKRARKNGSEIGTRLRASIVSNGEIVPDAVQHGREGRGENGSPSGSPGLCGGEGRDENLPELANAPHGGDVRRNWQLGAVEGENDNRGGAADGGREWWSTEPDVGRVAHGVAARVDRLRCIGNGQCPAAHAMAWRILSEGLI